MHESAVVTHDLDCLQINNLQIDTNDNEELEEDDDGGLQRITEDSDEEFVPVPSSLAPSTSTARRRRAQSSSDKCANGETVEEDSKKDSVQCPTCDKSFKSKYYLKVHNR